MVLFISITYLIGVTIAIIGIFAFRKYIKKNEMHYEENPNARTQSLKDGVQYIKIICK